MGDETKTNLQRVLELGEAVAVVGDVNSLDGTTTYRLGRLGDYCKSPIKLFNKSKEEKRKEIFNKQEAIRKTSAGASEDKKRENQIEVNKLNEEYSDYQDKMIEEPETIKIPSFKLSEFIAKEERKVMQKNAQGADVEITIKAGQSLVPVRFFALMGDAVEDDKSALTFKQSE